MWHGQTEIATSDYDEIKWISTPENLEPLGKYKTSNQPWDLGRIVATGETLDLSTPGIKNYVRAELIRTSGGDVFRTFTNPFGVEDLANN